jgi:hypothetical protein
LQYEQLLSETVVFSDAFATTPEMDFWIEGRRLEGPLTTGGFFQVLGVSAAHGRTFSPSDDEPGRPPVLVLSHRAWSRHFSGDPGVINRTVRMNGASVHVVGVMPEGLSRPHGHRAGLLGPALGARPAQPRHPGTR